MTISRRTVVKWGFGAGALAPLGVTALGQTFRPGEAERMLFPAPDLPGGGQLEIRMRVDPDNPDADVVEVARRAKPYDPESYYAEWRRVAEKNEALGERFEAEGRRATAHEAYLRAAGFYQREVTYMSETYPRMLPAYNKLRQMFDKAWSLVSPPFERVEIPYEGQALEGHFYPVRTAAGARAPVVFAHGGADTFLHLGTDGGAAEYRARGMALLRVDTPGQGGALRVKKLHAPPDTERVASAVVDYLVTRPDVDPNRIGMTGASMGGYYAPRAASGEKRIRAVAAWSGCYSVLDDLYDFLPSIQDRLRWIVGAPTLAEARKKVAEYTMAGQADKIECPILLCYRIDDRVMDPRGCLKLHDAITRAPKNEMLEGFAPGHEFASGSIPRYDLIHYVADWMATQLSA